MQIISNSLGIDIPQLKLNHRMVDMLAITTTSAILTGQHFTNVFRAMEGLLFLAMVSQLCLNLPLALTLLRDFLGDVAVTVVSPRFGFLLVNALVLTLFLKASASASSSSGHRRSDNNITAVNKQLSQPNRATESKPSQPHNKADADTLSSPPRVLTHTSSTVLSVMSRIDIPVAVSASSSNEVALIRTRSTYYRRINSEKALAKQGRSLLGEEEKKGDRQLMLRRSKTETRLVGRDQVHEGCRCKAAGSGKMKVEKESMITGDLGCFKVDQKHYPEDYMSSDEFRRTVEDFIAWKQNYIREEDDNEGKRSN